jgi:hypothetical protein
MHADGLSLDKENKALIIFNNKTTQRKGRSVDKREIKDNYLASDPQAFWSNKKKNQSGEEQNFNDLRNGLLKYLFHKIGIRTVIRIHTVLPTASENAREFHPGNS